MQVSCLCYGCGGVRTPHIDAALPRTIGLFAPDFGELAGLVDGLAPGVFVGELVGAVFVGGVGGGGYLNFGGLPGDGGAGSV